MTSAQGQPPHGAAGFATRPHPKVVRERLGHSDVTPVPRMVSHVLPGTGRATAERFDALVAARKEWPAAAGRECAEP